MESAAQPIPFRRDLIAKYDRPGPRYTSYPTAPNFRDDFGAEDHARLLAASRERALPLSLYVHVPFCDTRCLFCGCNVQIGRDRDRARRYLPLLDREAEIAAGLLDAERRQVVQVHWGGGTPTFLPPEELAELAAILRRHFAFAAECEFGVEVDPRRCTGEQLDALAVAGVNRLSLGVQDLDAEVQQAVRRVQPLEQIRRVLDGARARGIASINVDLIYGLPKQTPESFAATVAEVIRLAPDRLAVFNFAYLPATFRHQQAIDPATLPDAAAKLRLLEETVQTLSAAGYLLIGMDHFARPDDPLARALAARTLTRNFQGYSTCGETDLAAFGVSSISQLADGFAQNTKEMAEYGTAIAEGRLATCRGLVLSAEDRLRREIILRLMCDFRLDFAAIEANFRVDVERRFASELAALVPLVDDGLVERHPGRLEVTPAGRLLVRNVAMVFDAYLASPRGQAVAYSRTV